MRDITITNDIDAQLAALPKDEPLAVHLSGSLETQGVYMAGAFDSRNLGRGWTVDGDAEVSLVSPIGVDNQLLNLLAGPAQSVKGLSFVGNHSKRPDSLQTGAVWLSGDDGELDHLTFHDMGAKRREAFVAVVADGTGRASITNCRLADHPGVSEAQMTVFMIVGEYEVALDEGNTIEHVEGWVQGHTIYRAKQGIVRSNKTKCRIGYYADYFTNKNRLITGNEFTEALYGIQLQLSPTGEDGIDPAYFNHEDYTIGPNEIESTGVNVLLDPMGPQTPTRFMRNIAVHAALTLENRGATNVTRIGMPPAAPQKGKRGCLLFMVPGL